MSSCGAFMTEQTPVSDQHVVEWVEDIVHDDMDLGHAAVRDEDAVQVTLHTRRKYFCPIFRPTNCSY